MGFNRLGLSAKAALPGQELANDPDIESGSPFRWVKAFAVELVGDLGPRLPLAAELQDASEQVRIVVQLIVSFRQACLT